MDSKSNVEMILQKAVKAALDEQCYEIVKQQEKLEVVSTGGKGGKAGKGCC